MCTNCHVKAHLQSAWFCASVTALVVFPRSVSMFAPLALGIERSLVTWRLSHGRVKTHALTTLSSFPLQLAINDSRQAPCIIVSLLLPCLLLNITTVAPMFYNAARGLPNGSVFCTTLEGTMHSLLRTVLPAVDARFRLR